MPVQGLTSDSDPDFRSDAKSTQNVDARQFHLLYLSETEVYIIENAKKVCRFEFEEDSLDTFCIYSVVYRGSHRLHKIRRRARNN